MEVGDYDFSMGDESVISVDKVQFKLSMVARI